MEGESGVTGSIVNKLHSWDIQEGQMESERMVLIEVSSMKLILILGMSKEIKWEVKSVLLEVSLMN